MVDLQETIHALDTGGPIPHQLMPFFAIALNAVATVQTVKGCTIGEAVEAVGKHLTPGQPDCTVLLMIAPADALVNDSLAAIAKAAQAVETPDATESEKQPEAATTETTETTGTTATEPAEEENHHRGGHNKHRRR